MTNGLTANIKFYPEFDNTYKGVVNRTFNWLSFGLLQDKSNNPITGRPNRADDVIIQVYKEDEELYNGHGSWLSHLIIDEKEVWRIEDPLPEQKPFGDLSDDLKVLPSDSAYRKDVIEMKQQNWEEAEHRKLEMEV